MAKLLDNYRRVNRSRLCPICGRDTWCLIAKDGTCCICTQVPDGSVKYIVSQQGDHVGWQHILGQGLQPDGKSWKWDVTEPEPEPVIDAPFLTNVYEADIGGLNLASIAIKLGVSQQSLLKLRIGWDTDRLAHTFPMSDGSGSPIGIRLRDPMTGRKWAIRGSKSGIFLPLDQYNIGDTLLIEEGPTSTAALLTLGYKVVGRPFCSGGKEYIKEIVKALEAKVVIVQNWDEPKEDCKTCGAAKWCNRCRPGQFGAASLAAELLPLSSGVKIMRPLGHKDSRAWVQAGVSRGTVDAIIENTPLWKGS